MGARHHRGTAADHDGGLRRLLWVASAIALIIGGLGVLAWPRVDETLGQWRQHELAAAGDLTTSRYAWAVGDAYDELASTFEDAIVAFEVGALPLNTAGVAISREPLGATAIPAGGTTLPLTTPGAPTPSAPSVSGASGADAAPPATPPMAPVFPGSAIRIPDIGLDQAVVEGVARADLRLGPGHYPGTALPGEPGNMVISGHRTTYTKPFSDLDRLKPGDSIYIDTPNGSHRYIVESTIIVVPENVEPLRTTAEPVLTLTTCNPKGSARQRLVVRASYAGR